MPQQHPARDLQDTFYVSDPPKADKPRADPEMEKIMERMEAGLDKITGTTGSREVDIPHLQRASIHADHPCSHATTKHTGPTSKKSTKKAASAPSATATPGPKTNASASACAPTPPPSQPGSCTALPQTRAPQSTSPSTASSATKPSTQRIWPSSTRSRA